MSSSGIRSTTRKAKRFFRDIPCHWQMFGREYRFQSGGAEQAGSAARCGVWRALHRCAPGSTRVWKGFVPPCRNVTVVAPKTPPIRDHGGAASVWPRWSYVDVPAAHRRAAQHPLRLPPGVRVHRAVTRAYPPRATGHTSAIQGPGCSHTRCDIPETGARSTNDSGITLTGSVVSQREPYCACISRRRPSLISSPE